MRDGSTRSRVDCAFDDSGGDGGVVQRVNQNKAACGSIHLIGVEEKGQGGFHVYGADFVEFELCCRNVLERIDVHAVANLVYTCADGLGCVLQHVNLVRIERFGV